MSSKLNSSPTGGAGRENNFPKTLFERPAPSAITHISKKDAKKIEKMVVETPSHWYWNHSTKWNQLQEFSFFKNMTLCHILCSISLGHFIKHQTCNFWREWLPIRMTFVLSDNRSMRVGKYYVHNIMYIVVMCTHIMVWRTNFL